MIYRLFLLCTLVAATAILAFTVVYTNAPHPRTPTLERSRTWPTTVVPLIPPPAPVAAP